MYGYIHISQTLSTRSSNILQLAARSSETVLTVQVIAFKKCLICENKHKQVDILISKNQVLQICYAWDACKLSSWIRNLTKSTKIWSPQKYSSYVYNFNSYTIINTPYNWPVHLAASCLNIGYVSSYELIRIHN